MAIIYTCKKDKEKCRKDEEKEVLRRKRKAAYMTGKVILGKFNTYSKIISL